jgi:hypothetical protein
MKTLGLMPLGHFSVINIKILFEEETSMLIRIIETQEEKDLSIENKRGIDYTVDLLGNCDALHHNEETEEHEMTQEEYEWWLNYINNSKADDQEIEELAEDLGINESEIRERINQEFDGELENEHWTIQRILEEIREETQLKSIHSKEE